MINFAEIIGVDKVITLASASPQGVPVTTASSGYIGDRVSKEELDNCYRFSPLVFNSINKQAQIIMAAGYEIRANKRIAKFYTDFLDSIGDIGDETTEDEIFFMIFLNAMKFGEHFIEIVYNKKMTKIIDLMNLDPKKTDYARDMMKKVVVDIYGKPVGYVYSLPLGTSSEGDPVPEKVSKEPNQIFLLPKRIAHFQLFKFGSGLESVGQIEPAYKSIIRKHKIQEAQANSIYARGMAPIIDKVGNIDHYPTVDMINKSTENLAKMQHNRYFAVPYWHDIQPLEIRTPDVIDTTIKELKEDILASLGGMPIALATGSGEATNRSTLVSQQKFLEYSLRDMVRKVVNTFRKQIFKRIAELEGFSEVPEIVWGDIDVESKDMKAQRLAAYANNRVGILLPEDVRAYAIKSEQLDLYQDKKLPLPKPKEMKKELSETQKEELSGGWYVGEVLEDTELINLDENLINDYHSKLHVYFNKVMEGYTIPGWNINKVYEKHREILQIMKEKNIKHIILNEFLDDFKGYIKEYGQ